jgi:hypothetical protein
VQVVTYGDYGVCSWDLTLLCAPLATFSDVVNKIELGFPYVTEYGGNGNNVAIQGEIFNRNRPN